MSGLVILLLCFKSALAAPYTADWKSLDSRPLPPWFDQAKFGLFITWGVYSVPAFYNEWFWECWKTNVTACVKFMHDYYRPGFTYADFAKDLRLELWNASEWMDIFKTTGVRYTVFTTKHCEGYTMWPSKTTFNWNSADAGPKRNVVGEIVSALRKETDIRVGLYHALEEWYNPSFLHDFRNKLTTQEFVKRVVTPQSIELVENFKPDLFWSDAIMHGSSRYWNATNFIAWLYNHSPVRKYVVVNDRWGNDTVCRHGGYMTCGDQFQFTKVPSFKWENCMKTEIGSWAYRNNLKLGDVHPSSYLLNVLVSNVAYGGNLLLNIGPRKDGKINPIFEERLTQVGRWLAVHGEAIYDTKPWSQQTEKTNKLIHYTKKGGVVYAILLKWPIGSVVVLTAPILGKNGTVSLLGYTGDLTWMRRRAGGLIVDISDRQLYNSVRRFEAWVLRISNVVN